MGTVTTGSFDEIQDDLGGSNPIGLSEYYRAGSYMPNTANNSGVPKSGAISVADISSVDGGTGANSTAYNAGGSTSASTSTANKTDCNLSTNYTFACSGSTGWSTADGDGNYPSNATITWSGSGITFSGTGTSVTATVTSSGSYNTQLSFTATATGNAGTQASFTFTVKTKHDTSVDDLGSAADYDVALSSTQYGTSNIVAGLTTSVTATHSGSGDFSVNSSSTPGGTYNTSAKTVSNGNYIHVRQTASGSYYTTTTGSVTAGGDTFTHTVRTKTQDTVPDNTSMPADYSAYGVALSSGHTTGSYTLNGVESDVTATMSSGGTNGINMSDTSLTNGETCTFSQTASSSARTTYTGTATISGVTGMSDTTHSYTIRTGDNGVVESGSDYSPHYQTVGGCASGICSKASGIKITRTLKASYSASGGWIALYLYDNVDDYWEYTTGNSSGWVWHTTYNTGSSYSDISGSDSFKIIWADQHVTNGLSGMFNTESSIHSSFGGSLSGSGNHVTRTYTSGNLTLSSFPNSVGTATDVLSRTGEKWARCECYNCTATNTVSWNYSVYLQNVSGTYILGTAPTTGSSSIRTNASTTFGGECF